MLAIKDRFRNDWIMRWFYAGAILCRAWWSRRRLRRWRISGVGIRGWSRGCSPSLPGKDWCPTCFVCVCALLSVSENGNEDMNLKSSIKQLGIWRWEEATTLSDNLRRTVEKKKKEMTLRRLIFYLWSWESLSRVCVNWFSLFKLITDISLVFYYITKTTPYF